ncbi:MAG: hypothetical protein ACI3XQ_11525, partial [Eubacteriales bacterium]
LSKAFKPVIIYPSPKFLKGGAEGNLFQEVPLRKKHISYCAGRKTSFKKLPPRRNIYNKIIEEKLLQFGRFYDKITMYNAVVYYVFVLQFFLRAEVRLCHILTT